MGNYFNESNDLYLNINGTIIAVKYIVYIDTNDEDEVVIGMVDDTEYTFPMITLDEIESVLNSYCNVRCLG